MTRKDRWFTVGNPQSITLGPVETDSREWELRFTTPTGKEIAVELSPRALDQLQIEIKNISEEHHNRDRLSRKKRTEDYTNSGDSGDDSDGDEELTFDDLEFPYPVARSKLIHRRTRLHQNLAQ